MILSNGKCHSELQTIQHSKNNDKQKVLKRSFLNAACSDQCFLVSCFNFTCSFNSRLKVATLSFSISYQDTFSLSFSLVDKKLLNFSFSFSQLFSFSHSSITSKWMRSYQIPRLIKRLLTILLNTEFNLTQSHSMQYARLSAQHEHAHFRGKLRLADEK